MGKGNIFKISHLCNGTPTPLTPPNLKHLLLDYEQTLHSLDFFSAPQ